MSSIAPIPAPSAGPAASPPAEQIIGLLCKEGLLSEAQVAYARRVQTRLASPRSLLAVLQELGSVDAAAIRQAVRANPGAMRLGDLLIELGHLSEADLRAALAMQKASEGKKLGEILVEHHMLTEHRLTDVLGDLLGLAHVEPVAADIDAGLVRGLDLRLCREHTMVPLSREDERVRVAFADPLDDRHIQAARQLFSGATVEPVIARGSLIREALSALERSNQRGGGEVTEHTAMTIVAQIIREALKLGVSDIHIEPMKHRLRVRFRLDGSMIEFREISRDLAASVTSRLKILAQADIAERRRHQDGRIAFEDPETGETADIRASFYVTIHGEKVVLRLLNRKTELISIDHIGMGPRMLERYVADALDAPTGVVIVTGPTGSGKTTTLYSCVDYLNRPDTCIVTAEDPVEYVIEGISQCSINPRIKLTYEETLRHIVRQDPDVIVLGEIRDQFSAETAIQAALTGHKVLTTFHTEDSIGGLLRLLNMNIEAFLISSTVVSVVAQRLLRRVCSHCAEPYIPTAVEVRRLGLAPEDLRGARFQQGAGCAQCRYTGYRGRVCVFELLVLNEAVKDAILGHRTSYEIRRVSVETSGLVTLVEDGLHKAAQGYTTLAEVLRHLPRVMKPRRLDEIRRLLGDSE